MESPAPALSQVVASKDQVGRTARPSRSGSPDQFILD